MKLCVEKGLNFGPTNDWILYHDGAPAYKALSNKQAVPGPKMDH
jgi:hypothetical protein